MPANLIDTLNEILAAERVAEDQYRLQSKLADIQGYSRLATKFAEEQQEESGHADRVVARIDFLRGSPVPFGPTPTVPRELPNLEQVGATPEAMLAANKAAELRAIALYNGAIELTLSLKDHGTRLVLEPNLRDEEQHLLWVEQQLSLIQSLGVENWRQTLVV